MATTTTRSEVKEATRVKERSPQTSRIETARAVMADAVADAAAAAGSIATEASTKVPSAAATGRAAFDDANRRIRASSDEMLRIGTAVSFGLAAGLLIAGANRLLVALALVPVGMIGLTMLERSSEKSRSSDGGGATGGR